MLKEDYKILALLVVLAIVRGVIYISIVPPWLAPDEATHFEAIRLIGQEKLWPTQDVYLTTPMHPEMHASFEKFRIWQISGLAAPLGDPSSDRYINYYPARNAGSVLVAGEYPLIYHLLLSPVSALSKSLDIVEQLYLLRLFSLLFTVITIVAGWFVAHTIFPKQKIYAVALSSFLIFLPMHIHINTSVNSDVLTTLFVSLYFLALAKIFAGRTPFPWVVLGGVFLIISVSIKPTALFIIPTSVVAVIIYLARRFRWKPYLLALLLATMMLFTFLGAVFLFQLANGGRGISTLSFSLNSIHLDGDYFSQTSLAIYRQAIQYSFLSFWGLFGWANIPIYLSWVYVLEVICLLIGVGVAVFLIKHAFNLKGQSGRLNPYQKDILLVLLLSLIFALMGIYTPIIVTQSTHWVVPQSRYFFPALIPLALYFFLGFQQLIPTRIYNLTLPIWLASLIFFDSLVISYVLVPFIYG